MNITVIYSRPFHLQLQGKVERSHRSLRTKIEYDCLKMGRKGINWVENLSNCPLHLFSDDDNEEEFVGFPNRDFEWQEPEAEISPPPPCVQPTGPKMEQPEQASALDFCSALF